MNRQLLSEHSIGDLRVSYIQENPSGLVGLQIIPESMINHRVLRRTGLAGLPYINAIPDAGNPPACEIDPLVHLKLVGDSYSGAFAQGRTMRCSGSNARFKYAGQQQSQSGSVKTITTTLRSDDGLIIEHLLACTSYKPVMEILTRFTNQSTQPVTLELLSSFSLGMITPFASDDAAGRLQVHRFRSVWSAEGRLQTETIEQLHLERSWSGAGLFSERFGTLGTMPVRGWFPFVAIEDIEAGVTWGAQLAWAGSWQMEISRQHDEVCISGGLADREFGHWLKKLDPGETIQSPAAIVTCVKGNLDDLCDRLTQHHASSLLALPKVEEDLPIVFNEWCTTWGDPAHNRVEAIAECLKGSDVKYLVIDAGWYKGDGGSWGTAHGDWIPNARMFPSGLDGIAAAIRKRGLIPGLWFEMETVGDTSSAFSLVDHLLKRDGQPITVRNRRFWNLNDPFVIDYLSDRVIRTLKEGDFGYLKVDYNETAGIGCDGSESLGEGLRKHVDGIYRFFDKIRNELPDLVIENCSSGGHRLEPSMLARTAMSSFSDAHELVEIPIIAANLHRLIPPRQNQIWAVLHSADSEQRLTYSLAATFLGRMCLSGEIDQLNPRQMQLVVESQKLYRLASPIIRNGLSRIYGTTGSSWRHPSGWQAVVRTSLDNLRQLIVVHIFSNAPNRIEIPIHSNHVMRSLGCDFKMIDKKLILENPADFTALVVVSQSDGI